MTGRPGSRRPGRCRWPEVEGSWGQALPWLAGSLLLLLALSLLQRPLGALLKLIGRTGAGLAFLALFAPIGQLFGAGLGVNLFNALILGVLGGPGLGLLLMTRWLLR